MEIVRTDQLRPGDIVMYNDRPSKIADTFLHQDGSRFRKNTDPVWEVTFRDYQAITVPGGQTWEKVELTGV